MTPEDSRSQRAVILHVDDLGMCPGANRAFLELAAAGQVTCGSVMVPCPAFRQIAEAATADPTLDLGVHLTLTSEWERLRWAPLSTRSKASGLIDDDGCFWRDVRALAAHLVVEAAEEELRAQVEHAFEAGIRPTHIDAHMGAAMLPDLLGIHLQLAQTAYSRSCHDGSRSHQIRLSTTRSQTMHIRTACTGTIFGRNARSL
ncbi:MAG: ChbG/HpnK family deacetylase [Xanthobacteraceae bacterium]